MTDMTEGQLMDRVRRIAFKEWDHITPSDRALVLDWLRTKRQILDRTIRDLDTFLETRP